MNARVSDEIGIDQANGNCERWRLLNGLKKGRKETSTSKESKK